MACGHKDFEAEVNCIRINATEGGDIIAYAAEVKVRCRNCHIRFRFLGLPIGVLPKGPASDPTGMEARLAMLPDGHMTSMMADVPGFEMTEPVDERKE